jgi:CHASE2 domain-containing sensor protein
VRLIRHPENRSALLPAILCACAVGFLLYWVRFGEGISFDALVWFRSGHTPSEAVIVTLDETTYADKSLNKRYDGYPKFDRETHADFLNRLKKDGATVVVFDLFFKEAQAEDFLLANAISNHGKVVIACEIQELTPPAKGWKTNDPAKVFLNLPGCTISLPLADKDVVRTFQPELPYRPSSALAAAKAWTNAMGMSPKAERWVKFYGDRGGLTPETYRHAVDRSAGYFKGKAVFIGGQPSIPLLTEPSDEFRTPWTRWTGKKMRGVEVVATMFLNLIHNDWLTRLAMRDEIILIFLVGIIFGWIFTLFRPVPGLILVPIGLAAVSFGALALLWTQPIWFNWMVIGWIEIPLAWATSAVIYSRVLFRETVTLKHQRDSLIKELDSIRPHPLAPGAIMPPPPRPLPSPHELDKIEPKTIKEPVIHQYTILKKIGEGAFGQVWLARDRVRSYCAIKTVFRKNFSDQRPFEREFEGVCNFKPISGRHPGWVPILHVGINENDGFFYYVMDAADDLETGQNIDPDKYTPKTLGKLLIEKTHLPVPECIRLGIELSDALAALHAHQLVHRDVKPSNIIFAHNKARLADIGLVTQFTNSGSIVGTEGFIPPEGPGTPVADIFSLGRVLYMTATGCPPDRHPELPTSLNGRGDARDLMRLMAVINKACERNQAQRYQTAGELHDDLVKLRMAFAEVGI